MKQHLDGFLHMKWGPMVLFGRDQEIKRLLALIQSPHDSAVVVIGGHGSGKSSLLAEIPGLHCHRTVLLRVNPAESSWSFSGLAAILNGINHPALAQVLEQLADPATAGLDLAATASRLLGALRQRSETLRQHSETRTVILIDDADELDSSSQAVIGFLARRLAGTGIVLIAAMRAELPEGPFARTPSLYLPNLSHYDTVRMLESISLTNTTAATIHAVAAATQGNPLASIELYEELLHNQLQGNYARPVPLTWKGSFETDLAASISTLSPCAKRALDVLSLSYRSSAAVLEKLPGELWPGVDELVSSGIAVHSGPHVRIQSHMLRAHAFSAMPSATRLANHRLLAAVTETEDPMAWPWHVSFVGKPRDASFRLLRFAVELVRAGETPIALEYIERALSLNPWEAETAARLTTISEVLFSRGELVHAKRYLDWARKITRNRALTLRLTGLDFQIELLKGNSVRPSLVLTLVREFGHFDPAFSACLLSIAALYMAERWELGEARRLLQLAEKFIEAASGEALAVNMRAKLLVDAVGGSPASVRRTADGAGHSSPVSLLIKGRALTYAENYEGARDLFALVRNLSQASDANWTETARYFAADNELRAGNFRSAAALIDEIAVSEASRQYHRGMRNNLLLWRAYAVGDEVSAQSCLADAQNFAGAHSHAAGTAIMAAYQGQFALMRGDLAEACAQLSRAAEIGMDFANPALLRCEADLVEVLVRLGRRHDAVRAQTRLEYRSAGLKSRWLRMAILRCRAVVADGERSLELFVQAQEIWQKNDSVYERARTILCYAERLKALGRPKEAKDALLGAKALFEESGAAAWTQHVDTLLLGGRVKDLAESHNPALLLLSDDERSLAQMVARGRRNKEIAASLYVSVRTVEVRLTGIYRKLGIQSRSHLTSLVTAREQTPVPVRAQEPDRETAGLSV